MGKKKKSDIEEEIDEFGDIDNYDDYDDDAIEAMVEDILNGDPDDKISVDNLRLVIEWIKRNI